MRQTRTLLIMIVSLHVLTGPIGDETRTMLRSLNTGSRELFNLKVDLKLESSGRLSGYIAGGWRFGRSESSTGGQ